MTKYATTGSYDAMLGYIDDATQLSVVTSFSVTYSDLASGGAVLAYTTVGAGDFTIANGDSSGRKVTVAQKASITINSTGTATHVALLKTATSEIIYITECTAQSLTSGGTVTVPSWKIEVAAPT